MTLFDRLVVAWVRHREFAAALAEFEHLSERDLRELNLSRADIPAIARHEADLRTAEILRRRDQRRGAVRPASTGAARAGRS